MMPVSAGHEVFVGDKDVEVVLQPFCDLPATGGVVRPHAIDVPDEDLSPIVGDSSGVAAIQPTVLVHRLHDMNDRIHEFPARDVYSPQVESGVIQHPEHGPLVVRRHRGHTGLTRRKLQRQRVFLANGVIGN